MYFAYFVRSAGHTFRVDTRIYLNDSGKPGLKDVCVAAIVAKNPGAASATTFGSLAPLRLTNDKMLPTVRNHFIEAFRVAGKCIPAGAFVRVWNLFYLCDPKLNQAVRKHSGIAAPPVCSSEASCPAIVWFAWGRSHRILDAMKARFATVPAATPFFYDWEKCAIVTRVPGPNDCAKHPQGLAREKILPFLAQHV